MSDDLAGRTCTPCQGGSPPLNLAEARRYLEQAPGWALLDDGRRIERTFRFKDFMAALNFVVAVGQAAEAADHHPDIRFGWGQATVSWQTHKINGLHENDFIMAAKTNQLAGEQAP